MNAETAKTETPRYSLYRREVRQTIGHESDLVCQSNSLRELRELARKMGLAGTIIARRAVRMDGSDGAFLGVTAQAETRRITWSAKNNSTYLAGSRSARTMRGAVRAAIRYGNSELMGEGELTIFEDGNPSRVYEAGLLAGTAKFAWKRTDRGL